MPIIPAIQEAEIERLWPNTSPGAITKPYVKNELKAKGQGAWLN
jgi:hypothetical protein